MVNTKKALSNPCPTCGKQRISVKTYREYVGNSLVVTTLTSCPDPECQKKRDKQLAKDEKFRADMRFASEKRLQEQKERRAEASLKKKS